jgi:hypothetical protein
MAAQTGTRRRLRDSSRVASLPLEGNGHASESIGLRIGATFAIVAGTSTLGLRQIQSGDTQPPIPTFIDGHVPEHRPSPGGNEVRRCRPVRSIIDQFALMTAKKIWPIEDHRHKSAILGDATIFTVPVSLGLSAVGRE